MDEAVAFLRARENSPRLSLKTFRKTRTSDALNSILEIAPIIAAACILMGAIRFVGEKEYNLEAVSEK